MSKIPEQHWTMDSAPSSALTFAQRRQWAKIANLSWRLYQGDEREALAIANAALHDQFWNGDDFLVNAWNKFFARYSSDEANTSHTDETNSGYIDDADDVQETIELPVKDDDGFDFDPLQRVIASNDEARRVLADAQYDDIVAAHEPRLAIVTEQTSLDFNPIEIKVIEELPTTDAERGLSLYEDHVEHLSEMQRLYQDYDQQLSQKYLEGK